MLARIRASWERPERFTVVLLSFKRPHNMQALVESVLLCDFVDRVIVFNNNVPTYAIRDWVVSDDPRVTLSESAENNGPIVRLSLSVRSGGQYFLSIDDDIFLRPSQLRSLALKLLEDPSVVHGVFGSVVEGAADGSNNVRRGLHGFDGPIDIVQRVYCYTRRHAENALSLAERVRSDRADVGYAEDILLSMAVEPGPNRCHDFGPFWQSWSSTKKGIALYRTPGFQDARDELIDRVLRLLGRGTRRS